MFLRTVQEPPEYDESEQVYRDGFWKEFLASQENRSRFQELDYTDSSNVSTFIYLVPSWVPFAQNIGNHFAIALSRLPLLYPTYNRIKNVSRSSGHLYNDIYPEIPPSRVTTKDLEVHYGHTGQHLGGVCEMRTAWRFNELKPRFYYAQGGEDYFCSRYMKKVVMKLLDSFPTTTMERRRQPADFLWHSWQEYVSAWDLTSFSTSLSELKFFVWFIARQLEDNQRYPLRLLDYHQGIIEVWPHDLLDQYNDTNIDSSFSIHRLIDRFGEGFPFETRVQQNSGMLGVAGNIGFSMLLHGYLIAATCGPDKGVCVGDDALAITSTDPRDKIFPVISSIGTLNDEKADISFPMEYQEDRLKFLKRCLYRYDDGSFSLNKLYSIPISVFGDGRVGYRTIHHFELEDRREAVAIQTGKILWEFFQDTTDDVSDIDVSLFLGYVKTLYKSLNLPTTGCLPGYVDKRLKTTFNFALPCIQEDHYDPRNFDWLDHLFLNHSQDLVRVPLLGYTNSNIGLPDKGQVIVDVKDRSYVALEDMGIVSSKMLIETYFMDQDRLREDLKDHITGLKSGRRPLHEFVVLEDIPERFQFMFDVYSDPIPLYHYGVESVSEM